MTDIGVVDDADPRLPNLKLDVSVFALIIGKPATLNRRFLASLFQVSNGGFHETHPIHHPIQMLNVIDEGLCAIYFARGRFPVFSTRFGIGLVPGRRQDVPIFLAPTRYKLTCVSGKEMALNPTCHPPPCQP